MESSTTTLARMLKQRGLEYETAYQISLMVRWPEQAKMMVDWMQANPSAEYPEIREQAHKLNRQKQEELRAQRQTERQIP